MSKDRLGLRQVQFDAGLHNFLSASLNLQPTMPRLVEMSDHERRLLADALHEVLGSIHAMRHAIVMTDFELQIAERESRRRSVSPSPQPATLDDLV